VRPKPCESPLRTEIVIISVSIVQAMVASGATTATTVLSGEPLLGTAAGIGTLFGGRAVGGVREDIRFATDRLRRMGKTLHRVRQSDTAV
jgi:hypothetical protein